MQPKLPFYLILVAVALSLAGYGAIRLGMFTHHTAKIDQTAVPTSPNPGVQLANNSTAPKSEDPSPANSQPPVTTVQEFKFKPAAKLPDVKGISAYHPMEDNTVRFAVNVWAGWGPIILANDGFKAGKIWKTDDGKEFKVELVLIDNPVAMRDAYAAGEIHIGWATLDMMPLILEGLVDKQGKPRDSRAMPRIFSQVDFSDGGDGVVGRADIKTIKDLRGRKVVLAQNSPSNFLILDALATASIQPAEVEMIFTEDAFQAAAAFNSQKDIGAAVSWSPDIYNLAAVKGNRMIFTTQQANKVIADTWFSRADFDKDNHNINVALVKGIFDAMEELKKDDRKAYCAKLMADGYNIPAEDTIKMFGDAHSTNWAENAQFFLNPTNPTNFEHIWARAYQLYRRAGSVTHQAVPYTQVMDPSIIQALGNIDKYKNSKDEYQVHMDAKTAKSVQAESDEILSQNIVIHFFPNSWDLFKSITKEDSGKTTEVLYDPNVKTILEGAASTAAKYGGARIVVRAHTDSSAKGKVTAADVKELSQNRAEAVRDVLVNQYHMEANRFSVEGVGWDEPADESDPDNNAKNRRAEIKVYSAEKQ